MASRKPQGFVDDAVKAAAKAAAKKSKDAAAKAAAKKVAATAKAKSAKKVVAKTTKKAASKANPRNSYAFGRAVVHGSPTKGLKEITPRKGSAHLPDESVVWAWDPKGFGRRSDIASYVQEYSGGRGSVYIGKVPRSSVKKREPGSGKIAVTKPMKVKKEITNEGYDRLGKEIDKGLLKSGAIKKPTKVGAKTKTRKVVKKAEKVVRKSKKIDNAIDKRKTKGSVV
jgi:hypothetical protein